ncbi:MAG: CDP-alcohol phosphatidyltransferase family protein, partial [Actinobacteria bacterium]|nr:CDP-alcohol phosphatidyltransferase family protein [Actinomycetota bacterium]
MAADPSGAPARTTRLSHPTALTLLAAQTLLIAGLAVTAGLDRDGLGTAGWAVGLAAAGFTSLALARARPYWGGDRLGPADWVTLTRAALSIGVAALVVDSFAGPVPVALLVSLASVALVLDAVDGQIARRTGTTSVLGGRLDGEVDAFLIAVLSVYVARFVGTWVLAIGAARYAFLAAGYVFPWLREPLPPRYWRKVVCAIQGIVLTAAAAQVLPTPLAEAALAVALVLLAESFGRDTWWLSELRRRDAPRPRAGLDPAPAGGPPASPGRGRIRAVVAILLTVLSFAVVWAALVAPDEPGTFGSTAFLRVPIEGLVLVLIAVFLPVTGRRILAVLAGLVLALVVVLKVVDYEIFTLFD